LRRPTIAKFLDKQPVLTGNKVRLRPRELGDAVDEYKWRTDDELCTLDATIPLTFSYEEFFERYSLELEYPGLTCNYAIETLNGIHIGDCSIFNVSYFSDTAEVGIMIGNRKFWDRGYGSDALMTLLHFTFETSDLNKVMLRTLERNVRAQKCFEKCGFEQCGSLVKGEHSFVLMEVGRKNFSKPAQ